MTEDERIYEVDVMTRVEGEGRFHVRMKDGKVVASHLSIFEAPRFFEAFLRGRSFEDVPDIVARICGICPVAYQMSSIRALESALGHVPEPLTQTLRRLLYCGEWIESHSLHIFMLHAPDFLHYPSAIEMAVDHRELVERGLRVKKAGNHLIEVLGGRAIHPVSPCVGGFTRAPKAAELNAMVPMLQAALDDMLETIEWAAELDFPSVEQDYTFVALRADAYPMEWGDGLEITGRDSVPVEAFPDHFKEQQVPYSNALQCRLKDGTPYLTGPMARLAHHSEKLHPTALEALRRAGCALPVLNPFESIVARSVEVAHAFAEALDIIADYQRPSPSRVVLTAKESCVGHGATEAPRGMLYQRYEIDESGIVADANIVPPTAQNQARIEADLTAMAPALWKMPHAAATAQCETAIRNYDPCISCATHFLDLQFEVETEGETDELDSERSKA